MAASRGSSPRSQSRSVGEAAHYLDPSPRKRATFNLPSMATPVQSPIESLAASGAPSRGEVSNEAAASAAVKVVARLRPPLGEEELQDSTAFVVPSDGQTIHSIDNTYTFELNRAFPESASQEDVYDYVGRPIIEAVLNGYNGTVLAYGQTGSGKTFSMIGPSLGSSSSSSSSADPNQGVMPRAAQQIFDYIHGVGLEGSEAPGEDVEFTLRCSFLEVHREQMRDLLRPGNEKLRIKELPQRGIFVEGLYREYVTCKSEVMSLVRTGLRSRAVAKTRQNQHSSRSHAILVLDVEQRTWACAAEGGSAERLGKLTLVDLAGSEKVSKSECVGETLEEAKKINSSLSALGKVIDALAEQRPHVPYRDSRLTRVLEEALGGNCRTTLLVTASASSQHYDETLSSLRFAARTTKVRNHAKVNYMFSSDQLLGMVVQLQRDLASAKKQIAHLNIATQARRSDAKKIGGSGRKPMLRSASKDSYSFSLGGSGRLAHSGSAPAIGFGIEREEGARRGQSLEEIDETSSQRRPAEGVRSLHSPNSSNSSRESSKGLDQDDDEEDEEDDPEGAQLSPLPLRSRGRGRMDEVWRPLAVAAQEALATMETALVAQEVALEEAGLLKLREEATSQDAEGTARRQLFPTAGSEGAAAAESANRDVAGDLLAQRFRALRHASDARALRWRLLQERQRCEGLALELEMRRGYTAELERSLEDWSSRASDRFSEIPTAPSTNKAASGSYRLASELRRSPSPVPSGRLHGGPLPGPVGTSGGTSTAAEQRRQAAARIKRPVPRRREGFGQSMAPSRSGMVPSISTKSFGHGSGMQPTICTAVSEAALSLHARGDESPVRVAGTGDTGEVGQGAASSSRGPAATAVADSGRAALEAQLEALQGELTQRDEQLAKLTAESAANEVRLTALKHEVAVKDALLKHLKEESLQQSQKCDDSIEQLIQDAMSALVGRLSKDQLIVASAGALGERTLLPNQFAGPPLR